MPYPAYMIQFSGIDPVTRKSRAARRMMGIKNPAPGTGFFKIFGDSERVSDTQTETGLAFVGIFHAHIADFDIR